MVSDSCLTESTWAMWFSGTRSTRDWPPGSELCLLLCSWQLLEEVPCNTQPAFVSWGWDVSALPDTLQGCTHVTHVQRALLCKSSRGWGQPGPGHRVLAGTKPWRAALGQAKQPPFGCACVWVDCAGVVARTGQKMCTAFSPSAKRPLSWEAKGALPSLQKPRQCLGWQTGPRGTKTPQCPS